MSWHKADLATTLARVALGVLLFGCTLETAPMTHTGPARGASAMSAVQQVPVLASGVDPGAQGSAHVDDAAPLLGGDAWMWGRYGIHTTMGGPRPARAVPERLDGLGDLVAVEAGLHHTLFLTADGVVRVRYSPPIEKTLCRTHPCPDSLSDVTAIAAGDYHGLVLRSDGTVWAWGMNSEGQVGDGTRGVWVPPSPVRDLHDVVAISAGSSHSLALLQDGTVRAWGNGDYGRLGDGAQEQRSIPVRVVGLDDVTAIAAGARNSLAVTRDGTVWIWGFGLGMLVDGEATSPTPVPVEDLPGIVAVAAGRTHSLALTADGEVWAWGDDTFGELGGGELGVGAPGPNRSRPAPVSGLPHIVALAAGDHHSLALDAAGTVWAWGSNVYGEVGGSSRNPVFQTTPTQVIALSGVQAIAARGVLSLAIQGPQVRRLPTPQFGPL